MRLTPLALLLLAVPAYAERITLPLNGRWQVGDSVAPQPVPRVFPSTVAVPGLVHNAAPPFPDVDAFDSLELVSNRIAQGSLLESARVEYLASRQKRNYFWYRRTFAASARRVVATLRVNKV
jgi:hypothetical protein